MAATPLQKSDLAAIIELDIERCAHDTSYFSNSVVQNLAWNNITVTVSDSGQNPIRFNLLKTIIVR